MPKFSLLVKVFSVAIITVMFSCEKAENEVDFRPLEVKLASDQTFNTLVSKSLQLVNACDKHFSLLNTQDKVEERNRVIRFQERGEMTSSELAKASLFMGYNTPSGLLNDLKEIQRLKYELDQKFPEAFRAENKELIEKAVKSCIPVLLVSGGSGPNLRGGNCAGIYKACTTVVAVVAVVAVGSCGPAAPFCAYGVVVVAAAGMELCRQEAIGCNEE